MRTFLLRFCLYFIHCCPPRAFNIKNPTVDAISCCTRITLGGKGYTHNMRRCRSQVFPSKHPSPSFSFPFCCAGLSMTREKMIVFPFWSRESWYCSAALVDQWLNRWTLSSRPDGLWNTISPSPRWLAALPCNPLIQLPAWLVKVSPRDARSFSLSYRWTNLTVGNIWLASILVLKRNNGIKH